MTQSRRNAINTGNHKLPLQFPLLFIISNYVIRQCWRRFSEYMLPATLEDAIVYEIELNSRSLTVHNEQYVISFHDLVVPAFHQFATV